MSITPGPELKAAREAMGKTASEMAAVTRITVRQIEGLEADDYSRIPAPMYVRGFIKLYAEALGLPPEPLLEKFKAAQEPVPDKKPESAPIPTPMEEVRGVAGNAQEVQERTAAPKRSLLQGGGLPSGEHGSWLDRWVTRLQNIDFQTWTDRRFWLEAKWPRIAAGVLLGLLLVLGLRACGRRGGESGEDTAPAPARSPAADASSWPVLEQPLIRTPEPDVLDLPRTLE
jgi:transcriptional regulator with XRE-family HTH domain